jgi:hypothetical protein
MGTNEVKLWVQSNLRLFSVAVELARSKGIRARFCYTIWMFKHVKPLILGRCTVTFRLWKQASNVFGSPAKTVYCEMQMKISHRLGMPLGIGQGSSSQPSAYQRGFFVTFTTTTTTTTTTATALLQFCIATATTIEEPVTSYFQYHGPGASGHFWPRINTCVTLIWLGGGGMFSLHHKIFPLQPDVTINTPVLSSYHMFQEPNRSPHKRGS